MAPRAKIGHRVVDVMEAENKNFSAYWQSGCLWMRWLFDTYGPELFQTVVLRIQNEYFGFFF